MKNLLSRLVLALLVMVVSLSATYTYAGDIVVTADTASLGRGDLVAVLYKTYKAPVEPDYPQAIFLIKRLANSNDSTIKFVFNDLNEGYYAVMVFNDVNTDSSLTRNTVNVPLEAVGFSNDVPMHQDWPSFDEVKVYVTDQYPLNIRISLSP